MSAVRFELESWSDAELKITSAVALLGSVEETLFQDGNRADSTALSGIRILLECAMADLDGGRWYGD